MNGFRITGYPAAAAAAGINTITTTGASTTTTTITTMSATNKINNEISRNTFSKHFNNNGGNGNNRVLSETELDLHINEPLMFPSSASASGTGLGIGAPAPDRQPPPPPPKLTNVHSSATTTAPIALKGNNPFLNSPSPTDNVPLYGVGSGGVGGSIKSVAGLGYNEVPEYAEPQRLRAHKQQRPHSIAVTNAYNDGNIAALSTTSSSSASASASSTTSAYAVPKALPSSFVDYSTLQHQQQLRQQQLTLQQQQQRLLQLSRQQQQLRNAVSLVSGAVATETTTTHTNAQMSTATTSTTTPNVDKEALYAAIFHQYRNSPTGNTKAVTQTQPPPPVPLHRNQQQQQLQQQHQLHPIVPRRSHSTPRPVKTTTMNISNTQVGNAGSPTAHLGNGGIVGCAAGLGINGNGPRPRSLDRFNGSNIDSAVNHQQQQNYQPPPIPLRRFAPGLTNTARNTNSPQPDAAGTPKFSVKKCT